MIVVDVEIVKGILGRGESPLEGIQYCDGWRDFKGMGVAVVCTYDTKTNLSRVFFEKDLGELAEYLKDEHTAGFNTWKFDFPLLAEHGIEMPPIGLHFDALREIWSALGIDPDNFRPHTHGSWKLDDVMQATFGLSKSGHGAMAPVWWQRGDVRRVVDYCLRDVWLEAKLVGHLVSGGKVTNDPAREPFLSVC